MRQAHSAVECGHHCPPGPGPYAGDRVAVHNIWWLLKQPDKQKLTSVYRFTKTYPYIPVSCYAEPMARASTRPRLVLTAEEKTRLDQLRHSKTAAFRDRPTSADPMAPSCRQDCEPDRTRPEDDA
jgi:hypothetical protein